MSSDTWHAPSGPIPDSDTESDVDMESIMGVDATKGKCWNTKQKLIKICQEEVGSTSSGRRPLNIAIIGPPGCGKSSLLNTIFASFSDEKWKELAEYGSYGELDRQVSKFLISYPKERYYSRNKDQGKHDVLMPTFLDMNGFEDINNDFNKELLKIVFYGRMKESEKFQDVIDEYYANGLNGLRKKYGDRPEYLKVDRIIFVCSGDPTAELPENLMKCVYDVAKGRAGIPVYGVMTKADKFNGKKDPAVKEREKKFCEHLGVPPTRFSRIMNYCKDIDKDMKFRFSVIPKLDVRALTLMTQVFSGALPVVNPDADPYKNTEGTTESPKEPSNKPGARPIMPPPQTTNGDIPMGSLLILITIQVLLLALLLHFGTKPDVSGNASINKICEDYAMVKSTHKGTVNIAGLNEICPKKLDILRPPIHLLGGGLVFIAVVIPIVFYTILNRNKNK